MIAILNILVYSNSESILQIYAYIIMKITVTVKFDISQILIKKTRNINHLNYLQLIFIIYIA